MVRASKRSSILGLTCPRCRSGRLFLQPYNFKNAYKMHERCPSCHLKYEREPGFFYGAMFISYAITGWMFIIVGLSLTFGLGWSLTATLIVIALLAAVIHNSVYRLSRSIWLHLFVKHDKSMVDQNSPHAR